MVRRNMDLASFLTNAPSLFGEEATLEEEVEPDIASGEHHGAIRCFGFANGDTLSCVRWDTQFHITSTDIIRALVHRFEDIQRPVVNIKKFEEGVFSDLRCLKPGVDARLELPRSEFLELLYKHHCVRTQKKQKVFYWTSVPHDMLFRDALERDLKREAMGIEPTTKITDDTDPSSLVIIGGVELPLSVPPTLAAHLRTAAATADAPPATARVSTPLVTSGARLPAPTGTATAPPSCAGDSDTAPLHPDAAAAAIAAVDRSEPHPPAAAPLNGGWPGASLHTLRRKTPGLQAEYDPYHSTPTPHHSPAEGAATAQDLLSLLNVDPNALITQDNVGDFSAILDELLSGSVQAQARSLDQGFALDSHALSQALFAQPDPPPATARGTSAASMDTEPTTASHQLVIHPAAAATPASSADSSPSALSMASAGHMSLSQTPELVGPHEFRGSQPMTIDDIDSLLATVSSPASAPLAGAIGGDAGSAAPGLAGSTLAGLFPLLSAPTGFAEATAADSAQLPARPSDDARQPRRDQKAGILPPPRSTRFSRFHPYLRTMARIAHQGLPTIWNRMPSIADPTVAAAAVNVLVAKSNAATTAAPVAGQAVCSREQQTAPSAMLLGTPAPVAPASAAGTMLESGESAGVACCTEAEPCAALDPNGSPAVCSRVANTGEDDGQRRYSCTFSGCTKQFKRHEHLKRHFRTHTGERPYKCTAPGCGKIFARMDNLNQHSRTHVNRKTAPRRASHNIADSTAQQQQQQQQWPELALVGSGMTDVGSGGEHAPGRPTAMLMDASDDGLDQPAMAMGGTTVAEAAVADVFAYGGSAAAAGMDIGPARIAVPADLAFLNREWILRNLGVQLAQQQQLQPLLALQPPLAEHNTVSLLRKMSKGNRVRVVGGTPLAMADAAAGRTRDEQAPYGGTGIAFAAAQSTTSAPQLLPVAQDTAGLGQTPPAFGPDGTSINPIWLASFLSQQQQQQQQAAVELVSAPSSRPPSLKRHLDEDDAGSDVAMSGNHSDGSYHSPGTSDSGRQGGTPVTGSIGANKFVRSDMFKSHKLPV
ncbi:hypothetical protein H4R19_001567 [Coemansia spiralis]|nr:hypothetical protein H4R19_001567 [Coemansia spiralis]